MNYFYGEEHYVSELYRPLTEGCELVIHRTPTNFKGVRNYIASAWSGHVLIAWSQSLLLSNAKSLLLMEIKDKYGIEVDNEAVQKLGYK